jgi:SAM-dependent MidA family methyltransferase
MAGLEEIIKEHIRADGPISLADYMTLCLSHSEKGYYMTRDPFGEKGDFTTAP